MDASVKLTKDIVKGRVAEVEAVRHDDEVAHGMEDALYLDLLRQIADGTLKGAVAQKAAQEAVKVADIEFARWCA